MNKKTSIIKYLYLLACSTVVFLSASTAFAQTTIAKWTFESLPSALSYKPGANTATTNYTADVGTGNALGWHAAAASTYSSPAGNGTPRSLSANTWTVGDYYQFSASTLGYQQVTIAFDQTGSGTGPGQFYLQYSTDGVNFTQFGASFYTVPNVSWSAGAAQATSTLSFDLGSVSSLANASIVYFRLVDASTVSISGGTVGTGGTARVDNFTVFGVIAGPAQIVTPPSPTTVYFGDTANFTVAAGGSTPITYQWYVNNSNSPLSDGNSGYGGTISGSTTAALTLAGVSTNQIGDYFVIVANGSGSATSAVAHLTVKVRPVIATNIAYLHTLHDANYVLTDDTNIYQVDGIVTTIGNLVSGTTEVESFYVQDATGGCDVFFRGGFSFPSTGQHVRITAPLDQFNGSLELAPINGNPAHSLEILDSGATQPVPAPATFNFATRPTAQAFEEIYEGRYLVISNVYLGVTNSDPHLVGNGLIFMTNLTGQVFPMTVANNPFLGPPGTTLPGNFATAVRGVMTQAQTSGTVLTNNYSIIFSDYSQIDFGTVPIIVNPIPLNAQVSGGNMTFTWSDASFSLQSATNVAGPYSNIPAAAGMTTYVDGLTNAALFYRLYHP